MTSPFRAVPRLVLSGLLMAGALGSPTAQEVQEIEGRIAGTGARRIVIGLPDPVDRAGLSPGTADELRQAVADDLDFSLYFDTLPQRAPAVDAVAPELGRWASAGASQILALTLLSASAGDVTVEARLYEIELGEGGLSSRMVFGRRYAASVGALRRLAHQMADEVVEEVTGQRGIARTRLAYVARLDNDTKEVFLADYDGARPRQITRSRTINLSPAWSPDGERLAFLSFRGGDPTIFLLSQAGEITQVRLGGGTLNSAPDWSPEGRRLAFSSDRDRNSEIYVHDLDSGRQRRLTDHPAIDTAPAWSPDGRTLAFTSDRGGTPQVYRMAAEGGTARRVSYEGTYCDSAVWSPRGDELAYVARIAGVFEIVVKDMESGEARVITSGYGHKENPAWSPDGRHLVFSSNRGTGRYALYVVHADGTGLRRITEGPEAFTPSWSP